MHSHRSSLRLAVLAATILASLWLPSAAQALPSGACQWDAADGVLRAQFAGRKVEFDRLGSVPCDGAPRDDQPAVVGLPHWQDVREVRLAYGNEGSGRGELAISPQDFTRGGNELKVVIGSLAPGAAEDFVVELMYDAAASGAVPNPLRVAPDGLDLNSDGDTDITMPMGQSYSVEIRHTKWPASFDLRALPAGAEQTVLVVGYRGSGSGINRFWGPTSGAKVIYYGGNRADVVDTYGGDDAIWASSGNNVIRTRGGEDTISATFGHDRIWAGPGGDYAAVGNGDNQLYLGSGTNFGAAGYGRDVIRGGPGRDHVSDAGIMNIALGAGSDELDIQGARGGRVDCGIGMDFRHHVFDGPSTRILSCDRYTSYYKVYPPIRYDWDREAFTFLCSNGRAYRPAPVCTDPR